MAIYTVMDNINFDDFLNEVAKDNRKKYHTSKLKEYGKKGGRPKKETSENLSKKTYLRITEKQAIKLKEDAEKHNLKISDYLRFLIFKNEKLKHHCPDMVEFITMLKEFQTNFSRLSNLVRNKDGEKLKELNIEMAKQIFNFIQEMREKL